MQFRPFLAALAASLCTGAALMVTLVNVELFGQGVLGKDKYETAFLLLWFLGALPIGALIGGWIATRVGDRIITFVGLMIAAGGFWLITQLVDRSCSTPYTTWFCSSCRSWTPIWRSSAWDSDW